MTPRKKMQKLRKERGFTLANIAKEIGVTTGYMSMIERGTRNISYRMAKDIATILGKKPDDIFYDDEV